MVRFGIQRMQNTLKTCWKCKAEKPLSEFHVGRFVHPTRCRECRKVYSRERYLRMKETPQYRARAVWAVKRRHEMLKSSRSQHTKIEWEHLKAKWNYTCLACGKKEPEITLTKDHIRPLARGGSNAIENIQPFCRDCNMTRLRSRKVLYTGLNEVA